MQLLCAAAYGLCGWLWLCRQRACWEMTTSAVVMTACLTKPAPAAHNRRTAAQLLLLLVVVVVVPAAAAGPAPAPTHPMAPPRM
jgi:hypothetical protein